MSWRGKVEATSVSSTFAERGAQVVGEGVAALGGGREEEDGPLAVGLHQARAHGARAAPRRPVRHRPLAAAHAVEHPLEVAGRLELDRLSLARLDHAPSAVGTLAVQTQQSPHPAAKTGWGRPRRV